MMTTLWFGLQQPNSIHIKLLDAHHLGFPHGSVLQTPPANEGYVGSTPGLGKSPVKGNSDPLQYSCLGNSMERGAWQATIHGVTKESDTTEQLNNSSVSCLMSFHRGQFLRISSLVPGCGCISTIYILLESCKRTPGVCKACSGISKTEIIPTFTNEILSWWKKVLILFGLGFY